MKRERVRANRVSFAWHGTAQKYEIQISNHFEGCGKMSGWKIPNLENKFALKEKFWSDRRALLSMQWEF